MFQCTALEVWSEIPYLAFFLPLCYAGKPWASYPSFQNHTSLIKDHFGKRFGAVETSGDFSNCVFDFGGMDFLREPQHTPVSHTPGLPKPPNESKWKEFLPKLLGLGYVPGVCWKFLRDLERLGWCRFHTEIVVMKKPIFNNHIV